MEDHALSLLTAELKAGKVQARNLMKHLTPTTVNSVDQVMPRKSWTDEPDCLNCHQNFNPPEVDEAEFNKWTTNPDQLYKNRSDDAGIMCSACHGQAHAVYPADNPLGRNRDNIQPLQYQGSPYPLGSNNNCKVCHTIEMKEEIHHPNMLTMFRNTE